ncbi:MAG: pilus assembly protein PilM [Planctomycetes bacterium]|nr:pilus assembly protein PilM [Planctomycetota bacterium]
MAGMPMRRRARWVPVDRWIDGRLRTADKMAAWTKGKTGPIGIDLGAYRVRVVQASHDDGDLTVVAAGEAPAVQGSERYEDRFRANASALRSLIRDRGFRGRDVVVSVPLEAVRIKNVRLPSMPERELAEAVRYEALERFQTLGVDPEIRHFVTGHVAGGENDQLEVVVLGVPRDVIDGLLGGIGDAGFVCAGLDVAPLATFRPFERFLNRAEDRERTSAFLDIGHDGSRVVIARGGEIAFVKVLDVGVAQLAAMTARALSVGDDEALTMVCATLSHGESRGADGGAPEAVAVLSAIEGGIEQLAKDIGLCLRYLSVTFPGMRPDALTCVGGGAKLPLLIERIEGQLGLRTRPGQPFRNIAVGDVLSGSDRRGDQSQWTVALGLAMKTICVRCSTAAGPREEVSA